MSSTKLIREFIEFTSPLFANIKAEKPLMFFDPSVRLEIKTSDMSLSFKNNELNAYPLILISLSSNADIICLIILESVISVRFDNKEIFLCISSLLRISEISSVVEGILSHI